MNKKGILTLIAIMMTISMVVTSCSLFKSADVKEVEEIINKIGEVGLDSKAAIDKALIAFNSLPPEKKGKVDNYYLLDQAQVTLINKSISFAIDEKTVSSLDAAEQAYNSLNTDQQERVLKLDELKGVKSFISAKAIFDELNETVDATSEAMSMYRKTWYYGIHEKDDKISLDGLADEVGIKKDELDTALQNDDFKDFSKEIWDLLYKENFSVGLWIVDDVFEQRRTIVDISDKINSTKEALRLFETEFPDYSHRQKLVDYWSKANSFYQFASNIQGSFNQFDNTLASYKDSLNDLRESLEYELGD